MKASSDKKSSAVRLAIIGTGSMASSHAKKFSQVRGCQIVAACDLNQARVDTFCREHGIPAAFTALGTMLKNTVIDAVSIVTSDPSHMPIALQCLKAGKHVFCEKPLALNRSEEHTSELQSPDHLACRLLLE